MKRTKLIIKNKMRGALGKTYFGNDNKPTGKVHINVKKHKGDLAELASTIKHELLHVAQPNLTEKQVYKRTAKTKIPLSEQKQLLAKIGLKTKIVEKELVSDRKPGDLLKQYNEKKLSKTGPVEFQGLSQTKKVAIYGLI